RGGLGARENAVFPDPPGAPRGREVRTVQHQHRPRSPGRQPAGQDARSGGDDVRRGTEQQDDDAPPVVAPPPRPPHRRPPPPPRPSSPPPPPGTSPGGGPPRVSNAQPPVSPASRRS